jgi:hypothetical protein
MLKGCDLFLLSLSPRLTSMSIMLSQLNAKGPENQHGNSNPSLLKSPEPQKGIQEKSDKKRWWRAASASLIIIAM